jgi:hypothetical protein
VKYAKQRDRCPLAALSAQLGRTSPTTRAIVTDLYDTWEQYLTDGVAALQARGEANPDLDARLAARSVLTAIQGGVAMLQTTDRITYLCTGLTAAIDHLVERAVVAITVCLCRVKS